MTNRLILAIDSATEQAGIALLSGGELLAENSWSVGGHHSRQIERVLREMLSLTSTDPHSLDGIAVASGPGSFNGLRVGISLAKGLATAVHAPLVGVSTLDVIGLQASEHESPVWALLSAGRSQVYIGRYSGSGEGWRRMGEYERVDVGRLCQEYSSDTYLAGEGAALIAHAIRSQGQRVRAVAGPDALRRPGYLAELGRRYFAARGPDQVDDLEPLYLRRSSAEENRARMKGDSE